MDDYSAFETAIKCNFSCLASLGVIKDSVDSVSSKPCICIPFIVTSISEGARTFVLLKNEPVYFNVANKELIILASAECQQ